MTQRDLGGWTGVVGAGTFFVGAALGTTVGVWGLGGSELLSGVAQSAASWRWGNVLLSLGAATSAAGMVLVASSAGARLARLAAFLWLIAGLAGLGGFLLQGEGTLRAAGLWTATAVMPSRFTASARAAGVAIGVFMVCGLGGSVAFGWHLRRAHSLSPGLFTSGVLVLIVALAFAVMSIPAAAELMAAWVSVTQLLPNGS